MGTPDGEPACAGPTRRPDPRLIGLNAALLAVLAGVTLVGSSQSSAHGQPVREPGGPRGRGDYTMVSGKVQGLTADTLYILDAANQEFLALTWNRSQGRLELLGHRSLAEDARYLQKPR